MKDELFTALKLRLRQKKLTYRELAQSLDLSEASIKRIFSQRNTSIDRLNQLCAVLDVTLEDLVALGQAESKAISRLTPEQEEAIVSDRLFMLVSICTQNGWTLDEIVDAYQITEPQCIGYLIRLESMGLLDLRVDNRVKLKLADDFTWIPGGPINRFFQERAQAEFLSSAFDEDDAFRSYLVGMLTPASRQEILDELSRVRKTIARLISNDKKFPRNRKSNTGILLAMRGWELSYFSELKR